MSYYNRKKILSSKLLNFIFWNWNSFEKLFFHFCWCQRIWSTRLVNFKYTPLCISFLIVTKDIFTFLLNFNQTPLRNRKTSKVFLSKNSCTRARTAKRNLVLHSPWRDAELEKLKQKFSMDTMVLTLDGIFLCLQKNWHHIRLHWYHGIIVPWYVHLLRTRCALVELPR